MRKSIFLLLGISFITGTLVGQDIKYDVASIPDSLKKDVAIIKRYERKVFTVTDIDRATFKVHQVFTVLNSTGKDALIFREYGSKFVELTDAEIKVYDALGKQTNKFKKKDFYERAMGSGLMDDQKGYFYAVTPPSYPVTVEYIYEIKRKATLHYPDYDIIVPEQSVEFSTFTANVPVKYDLRFKEQNTNCKPIISEAQGVKTYTWTVRNLKAIEDEAGAVSSFSRFPCVILAPNKFKMDDFEGDMTTWKNLGLWETSLQKGLKVLPDERKIFFKDLVKNAQTDREKAKIVYDYLQKNFRYVSIQLGIGGHRPFPADFTDQKKYGDCKALSFYMHSVLDVLGIKSYTASIKAYHDAGPVDPTFPVDRFNHVILCIPQPKDTIWLECTSNTAEFGVLGNFTENRHALLITENGGVLVQTPKSKSSDNLLKVSAIVTIKEDGSGNCVTRIQSSGEYKALFSELLKVKKDDQKSYLVNRMGFKQPDDFSLVEDLKTETFGIHLAMDFQKIPEFTTGTKMFLKPQLYNWILDYKLPKSENRKLDYYFEKPFEDSDTTVYILPEGFTVDALPQEKNFSCDYGQFTSKYWFDEKEKAVKSATMVVLKHHIIPAAKYAQVKTFFDAVYKEASQRIVIKKI